jgi:radical SAM superfamily enzyme YgiQ (UPF0313 family)
MKVGLINPPSAYQTDPSFSELVYGNGLLYVEAALRKAGHEVKVANFMHDANASLDQLDDCPVVGTTSTLESYKFLRQTIPELKRRGKITLVGGPLISSYGPTVNNILMRAIPEIDYGIIGEAEKTVVDLLSWRNGDIPKCPNGLVFIITNDMKVATGNGEIVHNLDDLPEIDYHSFPGLAERVRARVFMPPQMARGCYNRCSFCYLISPGIRRFSDQRSQIECEKIADLKPSTLNLSDDTFTYDAERAVKIGKFLASRNIPYFAQTRVNNSDPNLMRRLADTGCTAMLLGVESFDEEILRLNGKNTTTKQIYSAIKSVQDAGMTALGFFIVGLPGETRESIDKTLLGIQETGIRPRARVLIPLPGTKIYEQARQQGKIKDELELLKTYSEKSFGGDTVGGDFVPINMTDTLSDEELIEARDKMNILRDKSEKLIGE